jgi:hypothetical protein
MVTGMPAEIRIGHLQKTNQKIFHLCQLYLRYTKYHFIGTEIAVCVRHVTAMICKLWDGPPIRRPVFASRGEILRMSLFVS